MEIEFNNKKYNLPDFLIVGAAKSGTTTLHYNLGNRDDINFPKVKEPHFFSFYNAPPDFKSPEKLPTVVSSIKEYINLFKSNNDETLYGEASPSSLYCYDQAIKNIKKIYGEKARNIKIVIMLRNPIERAWSQYWHFRKNLNEEKSFLEVIQRNEIDRRLKNNWNIFYDYIGFGMYSSQVQAYQENFDNVKVFLFEDLKSDSNKLMEDLCNFIEIKPLKIENDRKYNPSGVPKDDIYGKLWKINVGVKALKPFKKIIPYKLRKKLSNRVLEKALDSQEMTEDARTALEKIYGEEIQKLYNILKRSEIKQWIR